MSTFTGINTAARALAAAQRAIEVTGQNVANANTDGYSRQRVEQSASILNQTGQFAQANVPGDGVVINGITRVSDALATATARSDSATSQERATSSTVWSSVENIMGDTGDTGLSENLTDLTAAWNSLSNSGSDGLGAAQQLVVVRSQAVVSTVNGMDSQLQSQYSQLGLQASSIADQATTAAANIAKLNTSIRETLSNGASANELMDQRDQYLNTLADLTGSRSVDRQDGTVDVFIGNATVVTGDFSKSVGVANTNTGNPQLRDGDQYYVTVDGQKAQAESGSLKGTIDGANVTLFSQWTALNQFTTTLTSAVNTAYTASGALPFFTSADPSKPISALNLQVAAPLAADPTTLQDSSATGTGAASGSDRAIAKSVLATFDSTKASWRTTAANVASFTQSASNRADLASQVSLKSGNVRDAVSGVNIDEEMTNLVAYQHAYSAAAKVLSTMDQALDTLINMVG